VLVVRFPAPVVGSKVVAHLG